MHLVDVTFSETMAAAFATTSYYTVDSDADLDYEGTVSARVTGCSTAADASGCAYATGSNSFITGTMQFQYAETSTTNDLIKGTSVLGISTSVTDLKGNAVGSSTYRIVIN